MTGTETIGLDGSCYVQRGFCSWFGGQDCSSVCALSSENWSFCLAPCRGLTVSTAALLTQDDSGWSCLRETHISDLQYHHLDRLVGGRSIVSLPAGCWLHPHCAAWPPGSSLFRCCPSGPHTLWSPDRTSPSNYGWSLSAYSWDWTFPFCYLSRKISCNTKTLIIMKINQFTIILNYDF